MYLTKTEGDYSCTAEHIIRVVDGGTTSRDNVVAAHRLCNTSRHLT